MNKHLWQRVESLLAGYDQAVLATCGVAEPQVSVAHYQMQDTHLHVFVTHASDHLFNLETQPELVLLSPAWKLYGRGAVSPDNSLGLPQPWQVIIRVQPLRLHILNADGSGYTETIDIEALEGEI